MLGRLHPYGLFVPQEESAQPADRECGSPLTLYEFSRLNLELDIQASPRRMHLARLLLGLKQSLDHGKLHLADALAQ